jgi:hypothetical protein
MNFSETEIRLSGSSGSGVAGRLPSPHGVSRGLPAMLRLRAAVDAT